MKKDVKANTNLAVLISGRGSNLKAIIDAIRGDYLKKVDLKVVIANKKAEGLRYPKEANIPWHIVHRIDDFGVKMDKAEHDKRVIEILERYDIDIIALAGYNQALQKEFVSKYEQRMLNIHPSLLPSFGGNLQGQKDALNYGVKISGCTVHFVDNTIDNGPIIAQAAVIVKDNDTVETLADRILEQEHIIYPKAIKLLTENGIKIVGRKVIRKRS